MPVKIRKLKGGKVRVQASRLINMGAEDIQGNKNRWGRTQWTGLLPCITCGQRRRVNSHEVALKGFSGRCLSCTAKQNIQSANSLFARRAFGPASHLYKKGFTMNEAGYKLVCLDRHHPLRMMADKNGRIREHRLIMAQHLGRPLEPWEIVHHKNGDKADNNLANLEILPETLHILVSHMQQTIMLLQQENERLRTCLLDLRK